jgi:hypothetical protein
MQSSLQNRAGVRNGRIVDVAEVGVFAEIVERLAGSTGFEKRF